MDMQTPFARITGLGSAKKGTDHFWFQRLTALANVPLSLFLVWFVIRLAGADKAEMMATVANPLVAGLLVLTVISFTWHMRLGVQVVIEDYVQGEAAKLVLIILNAFFSFAIGAISVVSILMLAFGG
ncbi:MAG: succinate dehydrogenase, hydrophobic membrane anchor protein [Hyphomicrobiaceae bacterium]|nr:succinate dehydrogenase, hydrophobic membrane anchor protein [Hyphomicrobiaceae bacterium]